MPVTLAMRENALQTFSAGQLGCLALVVLECATLSSDSQNHQHPQEALAGTTQSVARSQSPNMCMKCNTLSVSMAIFIDPPR